MATRQYQTKDSKSKEDFSNSAFHAEARHNCRALRLVFAKVRDGKASKYDDTLFKIFSTAAFCLQAYCL